MKNLHTPVRLYYPACAHARYFAEYTAAAAAAPWSAPPHPTPPTEEAGVVVDVWIDRWFQALEEGKSAEIWMDDDRRDAETDEHERGGRR